ncbi:MAG TPA: DUF2007 domain-containing protein [Allosphingosinicella sp.]|jgi:hypothetical protein
MALVELAKFYNGFEAGIVRGRLEAEGIDSFLFDFDNAIEGIGFVIPVRVMVDEDDLDRARRILADPS